MSSLPLPYPSPSPPPLPFNRAPKFWTRGSRGCMFLTASNYCSALPMAWKLELLSLLASVAYASAASDDVAAALKEAAAALRAFAETAKATSHAAAALANANEALADAFRTAAASKTMNTNEHTFEAAAYVYRPLAGIEIFFACMFSFLCHFFLPGRGKILKFNK